MSSVQQDPPGAGAGPASATAPKLVDHAPGRTTRFPPAALEAAPETPAEENDYLPEIFSQPDAGGALEAAGGVAWARNDRASPCYSHLLIAPGDTVASPKAFDMGKPELELLIAANRYQPQGEGDVIAFGIRGAKLRGADKFENVDRIAIDDARPDHRNFRCILGLYYRATGKLSAYTASTVPWHKYMSSGLTFNLLPTGCYIYKRGAHVGTRATVDPALRLSDAKGAHSGKVTVLRTRKDLVFEHDDVWDLCAPSDNIHCAFSDGTFSSLGCQTIKGSTDDGLWSDFAAALEDIPNGSRVDYVLVTGAECGIAAALIKAGMAGNRPEIMRRLGRLRMGSEGDEVKRLQSKLGLEPTGYFGAQTKKSLTEAQAAAKAPVDGIYAPVLEARLGWGVFADPAPAVAAAAPPSQPAQPAPAPPAPAAPATAPAQAFQPVAAPAPVPRPDPVPSPRPAAVPAPTPSPATGSAPPPAAAEPVRPTPAMPDSMARPAVTPAPVAAAPAKPAAAAPPSPPPEPAEPAAPPEPKPAPPAATATPAAPAPSQPAPPAPPPPAAAPQPAPATAKAPAPAKPEPAVELSVETLKAFAPKARPDYATILGTEGNEVLTKYGINETPLRFCHFMAQVGHECGGFTITTESLKYTAERMVEMFGPGVHSAKLTLAEARTLVGKEEAFAERVYGLGNPSMAKSLGNTQPGDGYKYRGRGFIQLTGRSEYRDYGKMIGIDLEANPDKAAEALPALMAAAALWDDRDLNNYADRNDIILITKKINGGRNGLDDRKKRFQLARKIWASDLESVGGGLESVSGPSILELGSLGPDVLRMKQLLRQAGYTGFPQNEDFDRPTHLAVVRFKLDHRLSGDGVVDERTWSALERSAAGPRRATVERPMQAPPGFDPEAARRGAALARRIGTMRFWGGIMVAVAVIMTLIRAVHAGVPLDSGWQVRQFEFALIALIAIGGLAVMVLSRAVLRAASEAADHLAPAAHIPSAGRTYEAGEASDLDLGIRPAVKAE